MVGVCEICTDERDLRNGACFDCVEFESLIVDKVDMYDEPVKKQIKGSEGLNILYLIMAKYRNLKK